MKRLLLSLCLLACAACSPREQAYHPASETPVLSKKPMVQQLRTSDATALPVRSWVPAGKPKAVIVALHGFNDYSSAFASPGKYMRAHGIALYAYDQRGFGHAPSPGIWPGEDNLTRDTADMVQAVKARNPGVPVYLMGESMGGAVAVASLVRPDFPQVNGAILVAPALWGGESMNPLFRGTLWLGAHTLSDKILTGEDLHILASDNIAMLRALGDDPYFIKATRIDAIYGLMHLMDKAYSDIDNIKVPVFLLYGEHDQVIPPSPIAQCINRFSVMNKAAYYPLGYHMLLRDLHGDEPVRDIVAWIADKRRPLPSGHDKDVQRLLSKFLPKTSAAIVCRPSGSR